MGLDLIRQRGPPHTDAISLTVVEMPAKIGNVGPPVKQVALRQPHRGERARGESVSGSACGDRDSIPALTHPAPVPRSACGTGRASRRRLSQWQSGRMRSRVLPAQIDAASCGQIRRDAEHFRHQRHCARHRAQRRQVGWHSAKAPASTGLSPSRPRCVHAGRADRRVHTRARVRPQN